MSAKSTAQTFQGKNPYGDGSRRGRGWILILSVLLLLAVALIWTSQYTVNMGHSIKTPTPQNSSDPIQSTTGP